MKALGTQTIETERLILKFVEDDAPNMADSGLPFRKPYVTGS